MNFSKRLFVSFIVLFSFLSCEKEQGTTSSPDYSQTEVTIENRQLQQAEELKLSSIIQIPEEIEGCSCMLAASEEDYKAGKFIYLEKYGATDTNQNIAFVMVDDQLVKLNNKQNTEEGIEIDLKYSEEEKLAPEVRKRAGTLTVTTADGAKIEQPFVGECGC